MERPSFFKVMIGDSFRTILRIPPNFTKHLGEKINKRSVLRSSGSRKWQIKMGIVDGQLFFQEGWERFVSDHSISIGDFLIFFYDGDVGFDVKIYGTTGCEKEECVTTLPTIKEEVKVEEGESDDSDEGQRQNVSQKVSRKRKAVAVEKKGNRKRQLCYKVLRGAKPTDNEKALTAACSFKTPHPHFVTTCRSSRTSYMTIPAELIKKYNLDEKNLIVLRDPRGTSWSVRLSSWRDGRRCLSAGWSHLYKKNRLKEGDVCIFEFIQGGTVINVHIFRAEQYRTKPIPESGERLLIEDDKERVLNAAKSVESRNPKFTIVWRSTRLYHVPIPKKVVTEVGMTRNQSTTVFDPSGKSWPVKITFRSYGQAELGIGWSHFSRGNNLALGDVCVFEFLGGADAIKVHITRTGENNTSAATAGETNTSASSDPPVVRT